MGHCAGCHTSRGGATYAGGRGIPTPFGIVYASNLTSDPQRGLGKWSSDDFWRALHYGRSRDGRLLYPAFPYTNYTEVTREDADALFAFLSTVPPSSQPRPTARVALPYYIRALAVGARCIFARLVPPMPPRAREPLRLPRARAGPCSACHSTRNCLAYRCRRQSRVPVACARVVRPSLT